jgi:Raf kinase inhibitor-like YbhB/YbcL family protein
MTITSTSFQNNDPIPDEHSYEGGNVSPPLTFSEVPKEVKSLLLIVEDPDAPGGTFTHWILYNISPATLQIPQGELPIGAVVATNDFDVEEYSGPKPPSGTHRYFFNLFALDTTLDELRPTDKRNAFYTAMEGHVIDRTYLMGTYTAKA